MPATPNKQRLLNQIFSAAPRQKELRDGASGKAEPRPVLEQFIYALCREGAAPSAAAGAFRRLQESFFDWNEIRVSSVREIADALDELPSPEARAQRIVSFLQEVFETNFSFDLEGLHKKGLKLAAKQLARYQVADDYHVSFVVQRSLGGHAIPLDAPTLRCVRRMGLIDGDASDLESVRTSLEHQVPKARGAAFTEVVSTLASEYCLEREPLCGRCPVSAHCAKALESPPARAAAFTPRVKTGS
jgi:endonuclease-3